MFGSLKPRENRFFELFGEISALTVAAAEEFQLMISDLPHSESHGKKIKDIEHQADEVAHRTIDLLHTVFITPLDRDDIHQLIKKLDDIVDFIDAAAQRIYLYGVVKLTGDAEGLARVCVESAKKIQSAVSGLNNLKAHEAIIKDCVEINRLENEGDQLLRAAVAKLFREETDTRQLIKLKEIYELLETVTDRCEDVANIIEGIVLEYA